jgi:hypothetical protein
MKYRVVLTEQAIVERKIVIETEVEPFNMEDNFTQLLKGKLIDKLEERETDPPIILEIHEVTPIA